MNKLFFIIIAIFLFSFALRMWSLNAMGRTWDEELYMQHGYKLVELIKRGDFKNDFFYKSYDHPPLIKYLYGITAHLDVKKKLQNDKIIFNYDLTYSRILSSIMFSFGVVVVFFIGLKLFSLSVGAMSSIILAMMPFSLGLSQLVTAESLKILIYPLAILSFALLIRKITLKRTILTGIITGIALQVKQTNILLIPILITMVCLQYSKLKLNSRRVFILKSVKVFLIILGISLIVFIAVWPQILLYFKEIYAIHDSVWNVKFSPKIWQITLSPPEVFFGRLMLTPIFYYVVYFFITIPIVILILFFIGFKKILTHKKIEGYLLLVWFIFPFLLSFYSWRQHGLRYIIEIYPAIALIAALGIESISSKLKKVNKAIIFLPFIIYLFIVLRGISPYYLDYFNELIGGVNNVYRYNLFQTGWWGQGLREVGFYLKNNAAKGSRIGLAISPEESLLKDERLNYSVWSSNEKYDYVVVNNYHIIRDGFDDSAIKKTYEVAYQVKADEAILATIYKFK